VKQTWPRSSRCTALAALGAAAPALASEGGGAGPFSGDVGNALWTLVIFGLVVWVLGKYAWGPILKGLQDRERFIRSALEEAKRDREAAEARLREYEERLASARAEATAIVEEGRRDAEMVRRKIEEESRQEAQRAIERAKREIGIARDTAVKELYTLAATIATAAAGRILERELSPADHQRLVAETIQALEARRPEAS
jgi:F-type H+-transporting ATPase subunit b